MVTTLTSSRRSALLALVTLAAMVTLAAVGQSQQAPIPLPAPQPDTLTNPIATGQLAFLNGYAGRTTKELMKDKQFHSLMKATIPRTEYHYGRDMPLTDARGDALDGARRPVCDRNGHAGTVSARTRILVVRPAGGNRAGRVLFPAYEWRANADGDDFFAAIKAEFAGAERASAGVCR